MRMLSVLVLILLLALGLASCGGGEAKRHSLGERVAVDNWPDVVVTGFRRDVDPHELYDPDSAIRGDAPTGDEELVVATVQLINDEGEPFQIDPFWAFAFQSQQKEIDFTYELFADRKLEDQTLPPGKTVEGDLPYTIVRGLVELELVYQPGADEALAEALESLGEGKLPTKEPDRIYIALE